MNARYFQFEIPTDSLRDVIEPLASFICAARDPHGALQSALKTLRQEVERTQRTAVAHLMVAENY